MATDGPAKVPTVQPLGGDTQGKPATALEASAKASNPSSVVVPTSHMHASPPSRNDDDLRALVSSPLHRRPISAVRHFEG